ncbi:Ku protein [Streptomyces montanus]|uniref:Ku protein n=1 Tax=Streptomyces montanus TaxID=2580423 RepID=A0A5R9G038_9ACTN|nr:Ku protein [Streptomyces montanus]TLS46154.1 Ku protein [Streptomyces montanus]
MATAMSVSFGLVSVPVLVSPATEDHTVRLHEVHRGDCGGRLRHRRVCELDGQEIPSQDVARGVERPDGTTVVLDDAALEGLPLSTKHVIEVLGFVPADTIDPISYQRAYYARPASAAAERPYEVLVAALARAGLVGIAKAAITSRERLAVLRPRHGVLTVHLVFWPDEIREPGPAPTRPVTDREMELAELLLTHLKGVDPTAVRDEYAEALAQLVAAVSSGRELEAAAAPREPPQDLMAALEASIRAARRDEGSPR